MNYKELKRTFSVSKSTFGIEYGYLELSVLLDSMRNQYSEFFSVKYSWIRSTNRILNCAPLILRNSLVILLPNSLHSCLFKCIMVVSGAISVYLDYSTRYLLSLTCIDIGQFYNHQGLGKWEEIT